MRKLFVLVGAAVILLAMSSPAAASSTSCNTTLTGAAVSGDLVVPDNGSCTINGSTVGDDVFVGKNAYFEANNSQIADDIEANKSLSIFLHDGTTVGDRVEANQTGKVFLFDSTINGRIDIWRATEKVNVCGNTIGGTVQIQKSGTDILVGDPLAIGCAGNTVQNGKSMNIHDNYTDVEFVVRGNTVSGEGDLEIINNKGPAAKFVENNVGGDELECYGNSQPFTSGGNTGWEEQKGQCALPDTVCNNDPNPQTVNTLGDLVVPDNSVCIITGSTVGDDVKVGKNAYFEASTSQINDEVRASGSQTVYLHDGTTVGGDVETSKTAQVFLFDGNLNESVDVSRSSDQVYVCGNQIGEDVRIADSGRDILFGDPDTAGCAGNTVADGDVNIEKNKTDVELVIRGNTVQNGDMEVLNNRGPAGKFVENNVGTEDLVCKGNEQPFTSGGNTGWDEQTGQCAIPPTTCNDPNPQTVAPEGDLVVPENGVCIITGSSVGDDVKVGRGGYFEASGSKIGGDLESSRALTIYLHDGVTVGGEIESSKTGQVFLFDSTLNDDVGIWGTSETVNVCGNQIDGDVRVADSGRDILIGDPLAAGCGANTLLNGHSLKATGNDTDVEFVIRGNVFTGGNLGVFGNGGPSDKFVQDNTGGNELKCFGNSSPFTGTPNGFTSEQGQCAEI
jgi:hypothetical protein